MLQLLYGLSVELSSLKKHQKYPVKSQNMEGKETWSPAFHYFSFLCNFLQVPSTSPSVGTTVVQTAA